MIVFHDLNLLNALQILKQMSLQILHKCFGNQRVKFNNALNIDIGKQQLLDLTVVTSLPLTKLPVHYHLIHLAFS